MTNKSNNRVALIILDGFGLSAFEPGNIVLSAKMPYLRELITKYPSATLAASGTEVGLEWGEVGNSEVGHFNIGAGRIVLQDLPRIDASIENKRFFQNSVIIDAAEYAKKNNKRFHILGIASSGGIHGHINHMIAMIEFAKIQGLKDVIIHAITDGRDTQPKVAKKFINEIQTAIKKYDVGKIATIVGRYFAMDRDKRWDRVQKAYDSFIDKKGTIADDPITAINNAYNQNQTDENLEPIVIKDTPAIQDGDVVICTNYRADRARQLMQALTDPKFDGFNRSTNLPKLKFVSFTNYGQEATGQVKVAFFAEPMPNYLADEISNARHYQLHVAETEKYAHVTYFLNAGREKPLPGEERILIPSPKVASYDQKPEMSARTVAREFIKRFKEPFSFGAVNFANPDMVGHTGDAKATKAALELIDELLESSVKTLVDDGVNVIITADHGNCEQMIHPKTGDIDKEHTVNTVPFVLIRPDGKEAREATIESLASKSPIGVLADVAPTVLELMNLPIPPEMTGQSLLNLI